VLLLAACGGDVDDAAPTPVVTASALPTVEPSPSPSPEPETAPAPLTGEQLDPDVVRELRERPAVIAKIENTTAAWPQAGLEDADVVIEELVEGGVTRFLAVFHSRLPDSVGPVRSARLVDAELFPWLRGVLLYSGARDEVEAAVRRTAPRLVTEGNTGVFRVSDRRRPHNLFADVGAVLAGVDVDGLVPPAPGLVFDEEAPPGARDCDAPDAGCDGADLTVRMSTVYRTGWVHEPATGLYRRSQNGTPQPTASGDPVGAANVVVLGVPVGPGGCCDAAGSRYVSTSTIGDGRAVVLRDGEWYDVQWTRRSAGDPFRLVLDGADMRLRPGPTWMHLTPSGNLPEPDSPGE
jgi:hypothetical protein